jgi:hypothetical protein
MFPKNSPIREVVLPDHRSRKFLSLKTERVTCLYKPDQGEHDNRYNVGPVLQKNWDINLEAAETVLLAFHFSR